VKNRRIESRPDPSPGAPTDSAAVLRSRIMEATFAVLMERGYAGASTIEIARRAKVSKRDLYALFGSKQGILVAMIAGRSAQMRRSLALPAVADRAALGATLTSFGVTLLKEICQPTVAALFRLAILEAERSPEVAHVLDENGRTANRTALVAFLTRAHADRLIAGATPDLMASQFLSLLFGDVLLRLTMRVIETPSARDVARRARAATVALLDLYPDVPNSA
jgi:AcrR family transcriptional regulator